MNSIEDRALNEYQASDFLGISQATLRILRSTGPRPNRIPPVPYFKIGRSIRYSLADLHQYREAHRVTNSEGAV